MPCTLIFVPFGNVVVSVSTCADSLPAANDSCAVIWTLCVGARLLSQNCSASRLPQKPLPVGLVGPMPIGSSIITSSAISSSHCSRARAWTQRQEWCAASIAGWMSLLMGGPPRCSLQRRCDARRLFGGLADQAEARAVADRVRLGH